jgi:dihydropteroate synthase
VEAIGAQVLEIENGTAGAVDPAVEALAARWRSGLLSTDEEAANTTKSEVFGVLTAREGWSFTRQELSRAVDAALKESVDRIEKMRVLNDAIEKEMKIMSIGIEDEQVLAQTRAFVANKLKSPATKPSAKASKRLLKLLRDVAAACV